MYLKLTLKGNEQVLIRKQDFLSAKSYMGDDNVIIGSLVTIQSHTPMQINSSVVIIKVKEKISEIEDSLYA